jgi:hypothetical protein
VIPVLYTAQELAEQWRTTEDWVYRNVPSIKLGGLRRFQEDEVKAWLNAQDVSHHSLGLAEVRQIRGTG